MALPPVAEHDSAVDVKTAAAQQASRRKRRRTTAGGANDDCFSCRKGSVKCGRERPYCSQCMHAGTQCGGYKTTLTWGVGVASRGKLRGLSCPVANKNADGSDVSATEMEARRRKNSVSKVKKEEGSTPTTPMTAIRPHQPMPTSAPSNMHSISHSYPHQSSTLPIPIPQSNNGWQIPGYFEHMQQRQHDNSRHNSFSHRPLQRLQTQFAPHWEGLSMPDSAGSVDSYTDHELHSPLEYPQIPRSMSLFDRLPPLVEGFTDNSVTQSSLDGYRFDRHGSVDHYNDGMSGSLDSMSNASYTDHHQVLTSDLSPLDSALFSSTERSYDPFDAYAAQQHEDSPPSTEGNGMSLMDTRFSSPFFHLSPRLQSLLDYYDLNVCPFLVTFDSPKNPYRCHILQLASHNRGLQNAIAALATNNLRMRRKEPRPIGFAEEITGAFDGTSDFNEASPEESMYKQMSIDQLNMQLTDPRAAQDDSVLATLLILCMFHVCDSGFSKFKTQLAGMQKLLSLRDPSVNSEFTQWVEMFFVWFDVMTSTVNDREVQIKGESLDLLDYTANLGALEQFSGCEGRLFKMIAKLGRINLLSQGRAVRPNGVIDYSPRFPISSDSAVKPERKESSASTYSLDQIHSGLDYENIDGNGWGARIHTLEEEAIMDEEVVAPDERREFWSEWYDMRSRLQSWQMDVSNLPTPPEDGSATQTQMIEGQRDMMHINESFRYSALLYIERLGHPILPSSHYQFQHLVSQALYHITSLDITSCVNKFLLWPLFIIGTECVEEAHRSVIRERCIEVQKESGFYNNISALEVLEKVWQEAGIGGEERDNEEMKARMRDSQPVHDGRYGQAFRWRRAMDRAGGEYIVI